MSADEAGPEELPNVREGLLSVPEAAKALGISVSTAWRWIDRGILPSVRIGPRRVFVRREDLQPLPVEGKKPRITPPPRMTEAEQRRAWKAIEATRKLREALFAANGYRPFEPESWVLINEARDERSRQLMENTGLDDAPS